MMTPTPPEDDQRRATLRRLGLFGLLANWDEVRHLEWLPSVITYEQAERQRRSLERRLRFARLGPFKPLCDFDWRWPKKIDRPALEELCGLEFVAESANVVLIGPNSTGKDDHCQEPGAPRLAGRIYGAVHHRQRHAQRLGRAGLDRGPQPPPAPLLPPDAARGR